MQAPLTAAICMQGYVATGRDDTIVVTADPLWGILISGKLWTATFSLTKQAAESDHLLGQTGSESRSSCVLCVLCPVPTRPAGMRPRWLQEACTADTHHDFTLPWELHAAHAAESHHLCTTKPTALGAVQGISGRQAPAPSLITISLDSHHPEQRLAGGRTRSQSQLPRQPRTQRKPQNQAERRQQGTPGLQDPHRREPGYREGAEMQGLRRSSASELSPVLGEQQDRREAGETRASGASSADEADGQVGADTWGLKHALPGCAARLQACGVHARSRRWCWVLVCFSGTCAAGAWMVMLQLVGPCASVLLRSPVLTESFHQRIPHSCGQSRHGRKLDSP